MQIRATVSPSEIREAAIMNRPRKFWLRFFAANWYATVVCILILGVAVNAVITGGHPKWGPMALMFAFFSALICWSWYRWNAILVRAASTASARSGTLSLDSDGIRTVLASGASTFVPWSEFDKWREGKTIFLLTGKEASAVLPIDNGHRESIRNMLISKMAGDAKPLP